MFHRVSVLMNRQGKPALINAKHVQEEVPLADRMVTQSGEAPDETR